MRIVVRIGIGLLLLLVLAVGLLWIFQDSLVKAAIQSGGTWATGVETRVDDVSAELVGGGLSFSGFALANPPGFSAEPCFSLRAAKADWETRSLISDEIHVKGLTLDGLALRIERNASGTNYGAILDHAPKKSEEPAPAGPAKKRTLVVDSIVLNDLTAELVLAGVPLASGPLRVTVPRIEIQDFRSDGATHELVGKLLSAVVQAALDASLKAGKDTFPADLTRALQANLDQAEAQLDAALQKELGITVDDAKKTIDGLKDVFGGKKKP